MCKRLIIKGCLIFGIFGQTSMCLDGRRHILASHAGVLSMAEPPNLVLQVNVSTLLVCIILFMCVCEKGAWERG